MDFLKKHFEKIILCLVLLGLAGAVVTMKTAIGKVKMDLAASGAMPTPKKTPPALFDLKPYEQALAQITNPPAVTLSGEHNLFNPVTWKRTANGNLIKIVKSGPDALIITNIIPLYSIIAYDHPSLDAPIYVMNVQQHTDGRGPGKGKTEYAKKDEKVKSGLYVVRGIKGAENNPTDLNLEILATGDAEVWVSTNKPYKYVDSYLVDLRYDPEALTMTRRRVGDEFTLDNEPYKIVEITNDAVRVQSKRTTEVKEIKWTQPRKGD